jgi:hypothetical protein
MSPFFSHMRGSRFDLYSEVGKAETVARKFSSYFRLASESKF